MGDHKNSDTKSLDNATAVLKTADPVQEVVRYYRQAAAQAGFECVLATDFALMPMYTYVKDESVFSIHGYAFFEKGETMVTLGHDRDTDSHVMQFSGDEALNSVPEDWSLLDDQSDLLYCEIDGEDISLVVATSKTNDGAVQFYREWCKRSGIGDLVRRVEYTNGEQSLIFSDHFGESSDVFVNIGHDFAGDTLVLIRRVEH